MWLFIGSLALAFCVSGICSLLEAVLLSLTPGQIAEIHEHNPRIGALWQHFKAKIERPITVILFLNTAAHTVGATVAGSQFTKLFGEGYIAVFSGLFTYIMLQFTEILPKSMGVRFNSRFAYVVAQPLAWLIRLLSPIVDFVNWVNRPFESKRSPEQSTATLEEISALAGLARLTNEIDPKQEFIIKRAWRLSRIPVKTIMIPAKQITYLTVDQNFGEALTVAHLDPHTRFPVCEKDDLNTVVGYLNFKEMVCWARTNPADPTIRGILRPVHFVTPEQSAADLLRGFVDQHVHMAIVRDSANLTLGLVTLEDIVEELVGEVEDEFDAAPKGCHALTGGTWMVGGGYAMSDLVTTLKTPIPDASGSLSAWFIRRLGRLPKPGEIHREAGLEFMARRVRRQNVFEVMVSRLATT